MSNRAHRRWLNQRARVKPSHTRHASNGLTWISPHPQLGRWGSTRQDLSLLDPTPWDSSPAAPIRPETRDNHTGTGTFCVGLDRPGQNSSGAAANRRPVRGSPWPSPRQGLCGSTYQQMDDGVYVHCCAPSYCQRESVRSAAGPVGSSRSRRPACHDAVSDTSIFLAV